jgi:HEAT repeat protein
MAAGKTMRQMLGESDPEEFLEASIPLLKSSLDKLGTQYLLTLLLINDRILGPLIDPTLFSLAEAIAIAKQLVKIEPILDIKMMRRLLHSGLNPDELDKRVDNSHGIRLLEIMAAVSDGARVLPVMSQLMRHSNPKIRSKAALLVGRSNKSCKWVEQRLGEQDARVRANAVESLWGTNSADAKNVFWAAVNDPDNRVAGNALLGLYRLGDVTSIPLIVDLATDPRTDFRVTGMWLMGETEDPRFLSILARMISDPEPQVRATVFRSIAKLKQVAAKSALEPNLQVRLIPQPATAGIWREVGGVIWQQSFAGAQPVTGLRPTQFVLYDDSRLVTRYSIKENFRGESLSIGFVLPRITEREHPFQLHCQDAFLAAFEHKRKGDAWLILKYLSGGLRDVPSQRVAPSIPHSGKHIFQLEEPAAPAVADTVAPTDARFHSDPDSILDELDHPGSRMLLPHNPINAVLSLLSPLSHCRGARVVVLVYQPETTETNLENWKEVIKEAVSVHVNVHVVAFTHHPELAELCAKTGGTLMVLAGLDQLETAIEGLYAGLIHSYSIRYCPTAQVDFSAASALKVRIYRPSGFCEGSLAGSLAMPHSEVA